MQLVLPFFHPFCSTFMSVVEGLDVDCSNRGRPANCRHHVPISALVPAPKLPDPRECYYKVMLGTFPTGLTMKQAVLI